MRSTSKFITATTLVIAFCLAFSLSASAKAKKLLHLPARVEQKLDSPVPLTPEELLRKPWLLAVIEQESGSNPMKIGDTEFTHHAYGPIQVRQEDLDDVNPAYGWHIKPQDCLGNINLSVKVFLAYEMMWATKKRLGHPPTNEDIYRIWNGGPSGYRKETTIGHWELVETKHEKLCAGGATAQQPSLAAQ